MNRKDLEGVLDAVSVLRHLDPYISSTQITTFLLVAQSPGITYQEIIRKLSVQPSNLSKNIRALGEWNRDQTPGLNLIELHEDMYDHRIKHVYLTPKGEEIAQRVLLAIQRATKGQQPA